MLVAAVADASMCDSVNGTSNSASTRQVYIWLGWADKNIGASIDATKSDRSGGWGGGGSNR